jgi:hypothetical protein
MAKSDRTRLSDFFIFRPGRNSQDSIPLDTNPILL